MIRKVKGEPGILEYHKGRRAGKAEKGAEEKKGIRREAQVGDR